MMWRRVAHRRPVGSSQATEPTGRGQRSSYFVASVERGPVHIGSPGTVRQQPFPTVDLAQAALDKRLQVKTRRGYYANT